MRGRMFGSAMVFIVLAMTFIGSERKVAAADRAGREDLTVLPEDVDGQRMLTHWLKSEAHAALDRRKAAYERLETADDIAAWQKERREFFIQRLGGFPVRTPLKPRVVGRLPGDGFRVEKVIYESRPGHAVTAILFLPESQGPHPGVIIPCGHTPNGKAASAYQKLARLHALHGIAALVYDPIGQGERYQILDDAGKPRFKSTSEHTLIGTCAIPLGWNCASFRVWDGIRSLDYLASRDDIDADHLGCTGNSGGGTLTEYLMALDERIVCAAPGSCVTTFARRIESIGPGDAEQNIFGQIGFGLDHGDYTIMRAPRPTLLLAGTQDFIDIRGAWEIHREANRIYTCLGYPERIDLVEYDAKHGYQQPLREAAVSWMLRWLKKDDRRVSETPWDPYSVRDVQCTERGQVLLEPNARSVFDIMADEDARLAKERAKFLKDATPKEIRNAVRGIAQIDEPVESRFDVRNSHGEAIRRDGYRIVPRLFERKQGGVPVPALHFLPTGNSSGKQFLYLHDGGKSTAATPGGPIEKLATQGHIVLAADLRGFGETAPGNSFGPAFLAYLLGKSALGLRTDDVRLAAEWLRANGDTRISKLHVIAVGEAGPPALHAVALHPERFASLKLVGSLESWSSVVRTPVSKNQLPQVVHGALRKYDLPDLVKLLPEGFVTIEAPRTPDGRPSK